MTPEEIRDACQQTRDQMTQEHARFKAGKPTANPHVFSRAIANAKGWIADLQSEGEADSPAMDDVLAVAEIAQAYAAAHPHGGRKTHPNAVGSPIDHYDTKPAAFDRPMSFSEFSALDPAQLDDGGFDDLFDFATSVFKQRTGKSTDTRLVNYFAGQSGSNYPSGGVLVPTQYSQEILTSDDANEPWLEMIDRTMLPAGVGKVSLPAVADRDRSGNDVGGLTLSRRSEGSTVQESTVTLTREELELDSAGTLVKVAAELLEDALPGSVDRTLRGVFASATIQLLSQDVIGTNPVGIPGGIINSAACYEVAKESMQQADTINGTNILKMRERMKPSSLNRAVWLVSPDVYRQLVSSHTTLTNDDYPIFIPGNGTDVPDTILGRPVYTTEACATLGDKGDIVFADLTKYRHIMRGPYIDSSPHIGFETNEIFFKYMIRDFGKPKYNATYKTLQNFEVAEFVTLAERA
jgi:HK97 family phage major capsid protein